MGGKKQIRKIALVLAIVVIFCVLFTGCDRSSAYREHGDIWALIKLNEAGEPIHCKVVDYTVSSVGTIYIYTENRMYMTDTKNVLIIEDLP